MTDANVHRSRPGYRYGVAVHSSRQEEGTPPCACLCHRADAPPGAKGWYCDRCHAYLMTCVISWPERGEKQEPVPYSHGQAIADGTANPRPYMVSVPDYYFLTCGNSLDDAFPRRHFKTPEAAEKAAGKLNDADVIESLDVPDTHQQRFERFRELTAKERQWWYGDAHPLARLPRTPGRYAIEEWQDDYSGWDTYETLEQVREQLLGGDVQRVVDLDTGDDVPFKLAAVVGDEVAAMQEP